MTPLLALFLIPSVLAGRASAGIRKAAVAAIFVALALWGVFTHAREATSVAAQEWNISPADVDTSPARVWDWKDPQFFRGLVSADSIP